MSQVSPKKKSFIFSSRVQSQVADANLGNKGLNAFMGVLDSVRVTSFEVALLGDGSGADCILSMDISIVGVRTAPLRTQLASMVPWARNAVKTSKAARALPPCTACPPSTCWLQCSSTP